MKRRNTHFSYKCTAEERNVPSTREVFSSRSSHPCGGGNGGGGTPGEDELEAPPPPVPPPVAVDDDAAAAAAAAVRASIAAF